MRSLAAFFAGLTLGVGLIVSGMISPAKVIGFLDLAGLWDPSLGFVMGGALLVSAAGFAWAQRRGRSALGDEPLVLPARSPVDRRLLVGAALFGVGWGIGGFCPGPGLVGVATLSPDAIVFTLAMLVGMALAHRGLGREPSVRGDRDA
ncbi:MAG: DUF6691 family protein [Pseudomonadota bacterium]|jgi:uncharacterized membrane protein YedE/YeeE